jgi:acylphosphatase
MMQRLHVLVFGTVQGVFFRANTVSIATKLGLKGFVRNLPDGSVEIIAEGERQLLQELLDWCSHGPEGAAVTGTKSEWKENKNEFRDFRVEY